MKINFIGTSHGIPSGTRFCSSTMIKVNNSIYLIDAGAPIVKELLHREENIENVRAVFTTHAHEDHINGLFNFANLLNWWFRNCKLDFYLTDERLKDLLINYVEILEERKFETDRIGLKIAYEGLCYQDENIKVTYIPNMHLNGLKPSYSILIESEGKKLLFTGDLSQKLKFNDFPKLALEQELDAIICECAHFDYEEIQPYIKQCKTNRLYFTHISPLSKIDTIKSSKNEYDFDIYIPEDGDTFII